MSLLWLDLGLPRAPNSQAKGVTIPLCHVSSMSHCPMCPSLGVAARTRVFLVSPICPLLMGLGTSLHLKNPGRRRPHSSVTHVPSVPTSHVSGLRGSLGTGDQDESVQELMAWRGVSPMSPHACADVTRGGGGCFWPLCATCPCCPHVPGVGADWDHQDQPKDAAGVCAAADVGALWAAAGAGGRPLPAALPLALCC